MYRPTSRCSSDDENGYEPGAWRHDVKTTVQNTESGLKIAHDIFYKTRLTCELNKGKGSRGGAFFPEQLNRSKPRRAVGAAGLPKQFGCPPLEDLEHEWRKKPAEAVLHTFQDNKALRQHLHSKNQSSAAITNAIANVVLGTVPRPPVGAPVKPPFAYRGNYDLVTPPTSFSATQLPGILREHARRPKVMGDYRRLQSPIMELIKVQDGPQHVLQGNYREDDFDRIDIAGHYGVAFTPRHRSRRSHRSNRGPSGAQTERYPPGCTQVSVLMHDLGQARQFSLPAKKPLPTLKRTKMSRIEAQLAEKMGTHWGQLRTAFRAIDEDKSGFISKKEFARIFREFNIAYSQSEIDRLWAHYDQNGSGEIDYEEFALQFGTIFKTASTDQKSGKKPKRNPILGHSVESTVL